MLVKAGADINAADNRGQTALMFAAQECRDPEIISLLLTAGADIKTKDMNGWTAYDFARENPILKEWINRLHPSKTERVGDFPIVTHCRHCSASIKILRPGLFQCPLCEHRVEAHRLLADVWLTWY
jgi:hypothetical protein